MLKAADSSGFVHWRRKRKPAPPAQGAKALILSETSREWDKGGLEALLEQAGRPPRLRWFPSSHSGSLEAAWSSSGQRISTAAPCSVFLPRRLLQGRDLRRCREKRLLRRMRCL